MCVCVCVCVCWGGGIIGRQRKGEEVRKQDKGSGGGGVREKERERERGGGGGGGFALDHTIQHTIITGGIAGHASTTNTPLPLPPSLSLSLVRTHTHRHKHTDTHTHTHTHTHIHTHTHTHTHTHVLSNQWPCNSLVLTGNAWITEMSKAKEFYASCQLTTGEIHSPEETFTHSVFFLTPLPFLCERQSNFLMMTSTCKKSLQNLHARDS